MVTSCKPDSTFIDMEASLRWGFLGSGMGAKVAVAISRPIDTKSAPGWKHQWADPGVNTLMMVRSPSLRRPDFGRSATFGRVADQPASSDLDVLGHLQGIVHLDAEIADSAFELGVPEQQLNCPQVLCLPVDQACFRAIQHLTIRAYCRVVM